MENTNVYGAVLAGGIGSRMGNAEKPKQFMELAGKPILVHTVEKFAANPSFARVIVLSPRPWVQYTQDVIARFLPHASHIDVVQGGETRNETVMNAIRHIEAHYGLDDETIIVTHDSVRPFVTHRMLEENIRFAREAGACDTVIPATDTIVESKDGQCIDIIPDRKRMYQGQTPQSFRAKKLRDIYQALTEEEKNSLTDACKIFVLKGEAVHLVDGEFSNIKITYPHDLRVAEALLGGTKGC